MLIRVRSAGIAIRRGQVLLHRCLDFWVVPGGAVELESSAEALKREMMEELQSKVEVGSLLWVIENTFSYDGEQELSIEFYYELIFPEAFYQEQMSPFEGYEKEGDETLQFAWHPIHKLDEQKLLPSCLPNLIKQYHVGYHQGIKHVIHRERRR